MSNLLLSFIQQNFGTPWKLMILACLCSFFILIAIIDLRYRRVPNALVVPATALTILMRVTTPGTNMLSVLLGGVLGFGIFALAALVRPGSLGGGDIKLAGVIGLIFGFPNFLWALFVGVSAGGLAVMWLLFAQPFCRVRVPRPGQRVQARNWNYQSQIPYTPFLSFGAIFALFYNPLYLILPP